MPNKKMKIARLLVLVASAALSAGCATTAVDGGADGESEPLVLQEQGSFAVGGTVVAAPGTFDPIEQGAYDPSGVDPAGQTLHGDHAYVFYQVPAEARELPLVFWHGYGQSAKTWQTTPDGREGFQTIFLRRGFPVYLIDQPRRGRAGRSTEPATIEATPDEQLWYGIFRLGIWPDLFPNVQFSRDPEALEQFFRQMTPNTGPYDAEVYTDAVSALFERIGPGVLITHSQSGGLGWRVAMGDEDVRAIASFEPASGFVFPEGEAPDPIPHVGGAATPTTVPLAEFERLTEIPIVVYYGGNIPEEPVAHPGQDQWRAYLALARLWQDAVNRHGGDVTLVELPSVGIRGNTHFPMSDLNNRDVADHLAGWLQSKGLD